MYLNFVAWANETELNTFPELTLLLISSWTHGIQLNVTFTLRAKYVFILSFEAGGIHSWHGGECHDLYYTPSDLRVAGSRILRWAEHAERREKKYTNAMYE